MRQRGRRRISPQTAFVCEHFFSLQKVAEGVKKLFLLSHSNALLCAGESFSGGGQFMQMREAIPKETSAAYIFSSLRIFSSC